MASAPDVVDRGGHTVERQQVRPQPLRRPAVAAGLGLLTMAILGGATNVLVIEGLVTADNAAQTAGDVLASEGLFRFGIVALLVVAVLDVIVGGLIQRIRSRGNSARFRHDDLGVQDARFWN